MFVCFDFYSLTYFFFQRGLIDPPKQSAQNSPQTKREMTEYVSVGENLRFLSLAYTVDMSARTPVCAFLVFFFMILTSDHMTT